MATQITADLPTLDFPKEVDYPTQEDWAAFSAAAELNFGILGGDWSTQMQLWKTQANAMSTEFNTNATIAQGLADYQGDWISQGYTLGQTVSVSGVYYICKLTHATGQNPTTGGSLYWNIALGNWNLKVDTNMSGYTSKTTPVDADLIPLSDSASSFGIKKLTWANLKDTLKTYFDTLYMSLSGNQNINGIKGFTSKILSPNLSYKDTPVNITSWSYATTAITLNVASHTFLVDDYIDVAGLISTTYAPNGIHQVAQVTATTIVYTSPTPPIGTATVSSATVKGYATVNGRVSESIGVNQTWQDVTANRVSGTNYINTTGKPIMILISWAGTVNTNITATINGLTTSELGGTYNLSGVFVDDAVSIIVPDNQSYIITNTGGIIRKWIELR